MKKILMSRGAKKVVDVCVGVKPCETVSIITEPLKLTIAETIASAVYEAGAEPVITVMMPREIDSTEPPKCIAEMMKASDAFISVVGKSITHTNAVKDAIKNGSRGVVLTQFSEEMLIHGGLEADFKSIAPVCKTMADKLANSNEVVLTTANGTNLRYSALGRRGNALYCMVEKGQFSTVPTVEANVSPLEGTANGIVIADGSIPYLGIGVLDEPVKLTIENGFITSILGGKQAKILEEDLKSKNDPNVYNIAEMGVGLNPCCKFVGFMLEDEGVYGSVHIGIGTSITLGGTVKASCHYDLIMRDATIVADGELLMESGKVKF
ncbi:leucyl aminopeptidase [Clostridium cadaveris]|uniref:aminopeptidase n=1 Tax=Clostridium cadaveris TaxID=1529 RepID=UPI0031D35F40